MRHRGNILVALAAFTACHEDEIVGDVPGVLFGVAASTNTTNEAIQEAAFTSVELKSERKFDLDRIYRQWDNALPGTRELWTIEQGRTPIVSFKTSAEAPWSAIANGDHDLELTAIAKAYMALPAPVFCIFDQSPENTGGELGTATDYAAATVRATPQIRAIQAFWSVADDTGFDSSVSALDAFRTFAADPYTNLRKPGT